MAGFEFEREPRFLDAENLVNLIAHAGPGASLSVRIRSKDGKRILGMGRTSWADDRVAGEPVVIFPNPENKQEERLIPLGRQVVYDHPPRINSLMNPRKVGTPFGEVNARQRSTNPIAGGYSFELIQNKKNVRE